MIRMFDSNDPVMGFVYSTWIKVQSDIKDAYDPNESTLTQAECDSWTNITLKRHEVRLLRSDATRFDADSCVRVRACSMRTTRSLPLPTRPTRRPKRSRSATVRERLWAAWTRACSASFTTPTMRTLAQWMRYKDAGHFLQTKKLEYTASVSLATVCSNSIMQSTICFLYRSTIHSN